MAFPGVPKHALETAWRISSGIIILMLGNIDARMLGGGGSGKPISNRYADTLVDLVSTGLADILERNRRTSPRTPHRDRKSRRIGS
jgi:hypothetical protein